VSFVRIQLPLPRKLKTISSFGRPAATEKPSMTVSFGKIVLSGIFAEAEGVSVTAASVFPILAQPFALIIIRKYVKDFQNRPMSAMAVKPKVPVHWKKGFTLRHTHKRNMRQFVPSHVKAYNLLKKRR